MEMGLSRGHRSQRSHRHFLTDTFQKEEMVRCGAAICETLGTMAFIFAVGSNPILTAPITSSYCLVTIVLARIFLKERLSKKQYISLGFVVLGIVLIGFADIFGL